MKILQVCPRYSPYIGGVEEYVRNISERLAKKHEVTVFTTDPAGKLPDEEIINGVCVRRFKSWAPNGAYYFSRELKNCLSKSSNSYDVIHAHNYHAFPALYAAQTKGRNKLIFNPHFHGRGHSLFRNFLHKPYKLLGKQIFRRADKIICVSEYEKSLVVKNFKTSKDKIVIIPNGINLDEFKGLKKESEKKCKTILCVSRLEKYKGIQYLIQVLPLLEDNVILEIVGEGPYKKDLVKLAKKLNVEDRVKFFSNLPRNVLLQKYANADVFALLSKHEAFGISVGEALCAGTPCIVSNTSALTEWVDNRNCFGVNYPIKLNTLANLIRSLMGKDVKSILNLTKLLNWDDVVEKLDDLYQSL